MAVVQEVLMFGTETWVMNPYLEKALEGFIRHLDTPDKADCMFDEPKGDIAKTPQR